MQIGQQHERESAAGQVNGLTTYWSKLERKRERERLQLRVISQCVARASSTSGLCAAIMKREEKSILLFTGS